MPEHKPGLDLGAQVAGGALVEPMHVAVLIDGDDLAFMQLAGKVADFLGECRRALALPRFLGADFGPSWSGPSTGPTEYKGATRSLACQRRAPSGHSDRPTGGGVGREGR